MRRDRMNSIKFKEKYPEVYKYIRSLPYVDHPEGKGEWRRGKFYVYKGYNVQCCECEKVIWKRNCDVWLDTCGDGKYRCDICGAHFRSRLSIDNTPIDKRSESARRGALTQIERGNGFFSEEAKQKSAEASNKRREERGGVWANESDWEQQIATEFGGVNGLYLYFTYDRKKRWPDIVFPDGHMIQIDDKSHRNKESTYEYDYDVAWFNQYGYRPLHLMLPHRGQLRRERFNTWRDVVVAYLNDELYDDEYILTTDCWYPKDIYYPI